MDRNALDWLFSTAPQALAALAGLIFAGLAFIIDTINKQAARDESREDICKAMKEEIHAEMKLIFGFSGISIIADLLFLIFNPIEDGFRFSFDGDFSPYLLFTGITLVVNVGILVYSLWFIIKVMNPNFFSETVKRLSLSVKDGDVNVKDYLFEYIKLEKALRALPIFKMPQGERQLPVTEMLRELKYGKFMDAHDVDNMFSLTRLRNLIAHGAEIRHVDHQMYDMVKKYTEDLIALRDRL